MKIYNSDLLGPSDAGKTTLIKILTGQLDFNGGTIEILDKDVRNLNGEDKKKIGIMMDSFGVYERLSCADNLDIFADIYQIPKTRIKEIHSTNTKGRSKKKAKEKVEKGS